MYFYLWRAVIKADLIANFLSQSALHLLGYPLGHSDGCDPARLSDANFAIFTKTWKQQTDESWSSFSFNGRHTSHYSDGSVQVHCTYMVNLRAELLSMSVWQ